MGHFFTSFIISNTVQDTYIITTHLKHESASINSRQRLWPSTSQLHNQTWQLLLTFPVWCHLNYSIISVCLIISRWHKGTKYDSEWIQNRYKNLISKHLIHNLKRDQYFAQIICNVCKLTIILVWLWSVSGLKLDPSQQQRYCKHFGLFTFCLLIFTEQ